MSRHDCNKCNTIRCNSILCSSIRCHVIQWNNMHFWPQNVIFLQLGPYNGLPNSRIGTYRKTPKNPDFGPKIWFLYPTPIGLPWGNSGYFRFSGRCPFGSSAGRCMAPIAENYHFWAKNAYDSIVSHWIVWYCMELNFILWYCIVSYCIALVLHGIAWYCKMLHFIVRYRIVYY